MAVIKADGYGHGMENAAQALIDNVDEFAVNSLDDVIRLRNAGFDKASTVLSASFNLHELYQLDELGARVTIYDLSQIPVLESIDKNLKMSIWLKVDTGMGRLGFLPEELPAVLHRLSKVESVDQISLMTHLANADQTEHPVNQIQISLFEELSKMYDFAELSLLNSAGIFGLPDHSYQWVRPGIMLYGISPLNNKSAEQLKLKPAMTFKSKLISVKTLAAGSSVGYGSSYIVDEDTLIGVVACGYGDGYPRHAPTGTPVLINGEIAPLIGRVSMDMICVNLSQLSASVGDEVVLWGEGNPVEVVAEYAGTIAYELICGVLPRVERVASE